MEKMRQNMCGRGGKTGIINEKARFGSKKVSDPFNSPPWQLAGFDDGAAYLRHFLSNTGSGIIADYKGMLTESSDARGAFLTEVDTAQAAAESFAEKNIVKQMTTRAFRNGEGYGSGTVTLANNFNWYAAIGSHYLWGRGYISKTNRCCYKMDLTVHIRDRYDFDPAWHLQPLWWLEKFGWAKSFQVRGRHDISVRWHEGFRFSDSHLRMALLHPSFGLRTSRCIN